MRGAIVAIIVSFVCVAARARETKPCPSDHICPVCTEQNGVRSCKVERPGQPELPQATTPLDISPPSAAAPLDFRNARDAGKKPGTSRPFVGLDLRSQPAVSAAAGRLVVARRLVDLLLAHLWAYALMLSPAAWPR
jgi:hypothetical protein